MGTVTAAATTATMGTTSTTAAAAPLMVTMMAMMPVTMKTTAMTTMTRQWHRAPQKKHKKPLYRMHATAWAVVQGRLNQARGSSSMVWG
jgi:hypothetical protein